MRKMTIQKKGLKKGRKKGRTSSTKRRIMMRGGADTAARPQEMQPNILSSPAEQSQETPSLLSQQESEKTEQTSTSVPSPSPEQEDDGDQFLIKKTKESLPLTKPSLQDRMKRRFSSFGNTVSNLRENIFSKKSRNKYNVPVPVPAFVNPDTKLKQEQAATQIAATTDEHTERYVRLPSYKDFNLAFKPQAKKVLHPNILPIVNNTLPTIYKHLQKVFQDAPDLEKDTDRSIITVRNTDSVTITYSKYQFFIDLGNQIDDMDYYPPSLMLRLMGKPPPPVKLERSESDSIIELCWNIVTSAAAQKGGKRTRKKSRTKKRG